MERLNFPCESPHVTRFEPGQDNEGGDGVTIAHLAQE
jgi:dsDNA-specific endonuclease/ATPase MutS2